jgi:hypothetical protein
MKIRPVRDWFSFNSTTTGSAYAIGIYLVTTMPEGVSLSLMVWKWRVSVSIVFGDWE